MGSLLKFDDAGITIGNQPVLQDINREIKQSENWAITKPTGSGKTVLAEVITGSKTLSKGKLFFAAGKRPKVSLVNFSQVRALKFSE